MAPEAPISVLVVDDDPDVRDVCVEILADAGFEALSAVSSRDALDVLASREVAVLLADLSPTRFPAVELLQAGRRLRPGLSGVMTTAGAEDRDVARARAAGASAVLAKPMSRAELVEVVRAAAGTG